MPETKRKKEHERANLNWQDKRDILASCNGRCAHCGKKITDDFTVEHMIPLSQGGNNSPDNLAALCEACNLEKADHVVDPRQYFTYLPKDKLRTAIRAFDAFCAGRDWMTSTNLFKTDEFVLRADRKFLQKAYITIMPTEFKVRKMSRQSVLEFMHAYTTKHGAMPTAPCVIDKIVQPYYEILHNDVRLGVVTFGFHTLNHILDKLLPTDLRQDFDMDPSGIPWITTTIADLFSDPGVPREKTKLTAQKLRFVFFALQKEIQRTLTRNGRHDGLRIMWSAPLCDEIAALAFHHVLMFSTIQSVYPPNAKNLQRPSEHYISLDTFVADPKTVKDAVARSTEWLSAVKSGRLKGNDAAVALIKTYGDITKSGNRRQMVADGYAKTPNKQKERDAVKKRAVTAN